MIKVAVIDDHPLILKAVVETLESHPDMQVVGTADHGAELQRMAREKSPNVIILDLGMSKAPFEPVTAVRSFTAVYPEIKIIVLTAYDEEVYIKAIIDAGAYGYILKGDDLSLHLPDGVRTVLRGERFYSPAVLAKWFSARNIDTLNEQELAVLRLAAEGLSNTAIAETQNISEKRVRNIMSSIYQKLNLGEAERVNLRISAVNRARVLGMLPR